MELFKKGSYILENGTFSLKLPSAFFKPKLDK